MAKAVIWTLTLLPSVFDCNPVCSAYMKPDLKCCLCFCSFDFVSYIDLVAVAHKVVAQHTFRGIVDLFGHHVQ